MTSEEKIGAPILPRYCCQLLDKTLRTYTITFGYWEYYYVYLLLQI